MRWRSEEKLSQILVNQEERLFDSLSKMDKAGLQLLLIVNDDMQLVGTITDGDVRRAILKGLDLKTKLKEIMNSNPHSLPINCTIESARDFMQQFSIRQVPLVDHYNRIRDLIIWADCYETVVEPRKEKVVIMAGGKGTRLDPFTKILPKPMIPIGDKPIIEVIMDKFYQQGFTDFVLSLGYKAEIIKMYFAEANNRPYKVSFIYENEPLGTAGALKLLEDKLEDTFVVTNCDVILEPNFSELIKDHKKENNDLTIVGSVKDYVIPYGVLKTEGQELVHIDEKPNFQYLINTGLYIIEPKVIKLMKENEFVHMTDLFERIKNSQGKVGVYPHHGDWFDLGQWEDYRNSLRHLGAIE